MQQSRQTQISFSYSCPLPDSSFLECRSEKEFLTGSNEGCTALVEEGVLECALDALAAEFLQSVR